MGYGRRGRTVQGTRGGRLATVAGVVLAGALALTACGSDDGDAADGTDAVTSTASASTSVSGATGAQAPGDSTSVDPSAAADPEAPGGEDAAGAPAESDPAAAPSAGGAASGEDAAQITDLTTGLNGDMLMSEFYQYTLDHYCTGYIDAKGGRENMQATIDSMRGDDKLLSEAGTVANITDVSDIRVDGDHATANVSGTLNDQQNSAQMQYLRENGAWTICPAA